MKRRAWGLKFYFPTIIMTMTLVCDLTGGRWLWFPPAFMVVVGVSREWWGRSNRDSPDYASPALLNAGLGLSIFSLFVLWITAIWQNSSWLEGDALLPVAWIGARASSTAFEKLGSVVSLGILFGVVGFVVGHELIHRTKSRPANLAARVLLAMVGSPSFSIEHVYGHHLHVGTSEDPTTARRGQSIYSFLLQSIWGQFRGAAEIEGRRLRGRGIGWWSVRNKLLQGYAILALFVALSAALGGPRAVLAYALALAIGRYYLEVSNYVQHYGIVRVRGTPVEPRHAWDQYAGSTSMLTFNMPRHADHHVRGDKPFWKLDPVPETPTLPIGYKTAVFVVLVPPLWRGLMMAPIDRWDRELANSAERSLLAKE